MKPVDESQEYPEDPGTIANLLRAIFNLDDKQREMVIHYVESLSPADQRKKKEITFSWAGGLSEFRDEFTSLELQKKASEWREQ